MRGVGITPPITEAVPEAVVPVLVVVTALGDPAVVAAVATVVYWVGPRFGVCDRRAAATIFATVLVALAWTSLLKYGFAMPRPPDAVALVPEDGAGFPSGHATAATAGYVALAAYGERPARRRRYGSAVVLVAIVALTRVLLGVHYLVDVFAGVIVGLAVLAAVRWVSRESLVAAFGMGAPPAIAGALLTETAETALIAGFVSGAALGWWLVTERISDRMPTVKAIVASGLAGAALLGVGHVSASPVVAGVTGVGTGALFLVLPALDV